MNASLEDQNAPTAVTISIATSEIGIDSDAVERAARDAQERDESHALHQSRDDRARPSCAGDGTREVPALPEHDGDAGHDRDARDDERDARAAPS